MVVPLNVLTDSGVAISPPPDVQRTMLGMDVLSRFGCNTWDEATAGSTRPFDAIVIGRGMIGGYCADKVYGDGQTAGLKVLVADKVYGDGQTARLKVLVLDAGPFVVPTHVQNLPRAGLNVPGPLLPSNDPGVARDLVWGMPWRSNVGFIGQAYCVRGKSLYWRGWCPRLLADPPLAVDGRSPASGLFAFDKYTSVTVLVDVVRDAAGQSDAQRRLSEPTSSRECCGQRLIQAEPCQIRRRPGLSSYGDPNSARQVPHFR